MKLALQAGGEIDIASSDDIDGMMDTHGKALFSAFTDGLKYARSLDTILAPASKIVSGVLPNTSASQGFVRSIRRISINTNDGGAGVYTGGIYLNDPNALGNFAYPINFTLPGILTISDDALILRPDDDLYLVLTTGVANAGSVFTVSTAYKEVSVDKLFLLDF